MPRQKDKYKSKVQVSDSSSDSDEDAEVVSSRKKTNDQSSSSSSSSSTTATLPSSTIGGNSKLQERKEQYAAIARERAAHFARGGGAGSNKGNAAITATTVVTNPSAVADDADSEPVAVVRSKSSAVSSSSTVIASKTSLLSIRTRGDDSYLESTSLNADNDAGMDNDENMDDDNDDGNDGPADVRSNFRGSRKKARITPRQSWPGPFATAQALLAGREAAARERNEELNSSNNGSSSSSSNKGTKRSRDSTTQNSSSETTMYGSSSNDIDNISIDDYQARWQPSRPLPTYQRGGKNTGMDMDLTMDATPIKTEVGTTNSETTEISRSTTPPSTKSGSNNNNLTQHRQPVGIAGPSGVRLEIPSLASLCLEKLVNYLRYIDDLSPLLPDIRKQFALAVCRARAMDSHAFYLFAAACGRNDTLSIADCAGVEEHTMTKALEATINNNYAQLGLQGLSGDALFAALGLSTNKNDDEENDNGEGNPGPLSSSVGLAGLELSHAGRGFTDRTVYNLVHSSSSPHHSHPTENSNTTSSSSSSSTVTSPASSSIPTVPRPIRNPFTNLTHLALGGVYALTDNGLSLILSSSKHLLSLSLKAAPLLNGSFLKTLLQHNVLLEELELESCPGIGDNELLGLSSVFNDNNNTDTTKKKKKKQKMDDDDNHDAGEFALAANEDLDLQRAISLSLHQEQPNSSSSSSASSSSSSSSSLSSFAASTTPSVNSITNLPSLQRLSFSQLPLITDSLIEKVLNNPHHTTPFTAVSIDRCPNITDNACKYIQNHCSTLHTLRLESLPKVTDKGLNYLTQGFSATNNYKKYGTNTTLSSQASASSLTGSTSTLSRMEDLVINRCAQLSTIPLVAFLLRVTSSGSLRRVSLQGLPGLSNECLVVLSKYAYHSLQTLDISMCRNITDEGVGILADTCTKLSTLVLWGNTQITGTFYLGHKRANQRNPYAIVDDISDDDGENKDNDASTRNMDTDNVRTPEKGRNSRTQHRDYPAKSSSDKHTTSNAKVNTKELRKQQKLIDDEIASWSILHIYGKTGDIMPAPRI